MLCVPSCLSLVYIIITGKIHDFRYVRYLFSEDQEELVGVYASQLQRDLCINLFVEMMELRLNSRYCYHMFG
jgi:nuclear pore complex protein Nup107